MKKFGNVENSLKGGLQFYSDLQVCARPRLPDPSYPWGRHPCCVSSFCHEGAGASDQ